MYQCCKEYSTVKDHTATIPRDTDYTFAYEFQADGEFTFDKQGNKSKVRCFFTSVYIDDIELVNKGLEKEALVENLGIAIENLSIQQTEILIKQMAETAQKNDNIRKKEAEPYIEIESKLNEEVKQLNELSSNEDKEEKQEENSVNDETDEYLNWENLDDNKTTHNQQVQIMQVAEVVDKEKLEEEREKWICRKNAQKFAEKIRKLEYEPGFDFDPTQKNLGHLEKVVYEIYPRTSQTIQHFKNIRRKRKTASGRSNSHTSPATTSKSESFEIDEEEEIGGEDDKIDRKELSFEEKLQFKFGYEPKRDRRLIAKLARKFLLKNDPKMIKYWCQRYRYFSLLDKGILMDKQCWFSVTPELLAKHVAERLVPIKGCTIFDPFTGSGCNSIQFALRGAFVYAVDLDPIKLLCANHNAKIYGASNRINFICGDFFQIVHSMIGALEAKRKNKYCTISYQNDDPYSLIIDAVYLSPPWGGPTYSSTDLNEFDIEKDMNLDGFKIFDTAKQISQNIAYFLPRNTSVNQLITLAGPGGFVELEHGRLNEKVKALHAYYGRLVPNK